MMRESILKRIFIISIFIVLTAGAALAQTTAFNFQGRLNDGANPANGNFEMQFKLFSALSGGSQIGATVSRPSVAVINGIFSTVLDFGAAPFDGSARFIEIGVRPLGTTNPFSILSPRQQILSTPYAIMAKNATQLGGIDASQYVTTTTVGNSFIKNSTVQQTGNFNISGGGIIGDSLGIGITPGIGSKLDVNGQTVIRTGGIAGGGFTFGTPNGETGFTVNGTNSPSRADLRFDGFSMSLVVGLGGVGPPPVTNGIAIHQAGDVSIGPYAQGRGKLFVSGGNFTSLYVEDNSGRTVDVNNTRAGAIAIHATAGSGIGVYGSGSVFGVFSGGPLGMLTLGTGGDTQLCRNSNSGVIANCSSSLRYKKDFQPFGDGLNFINQLRPIAYKWKSNDKPDIGFGAEDMAKINPLFVTYNAQGEVEGVKYDRLSVVFVNAFKEQQKQIEQQQKQIEILTKLICLDHPDTTFCQQK